VLKLLRSHKLAWVASIFIVSPLRSDDGFTIAMPGKDSGGIIVTILLGIGGAFVGGFIGSALGLGAVTGFNLGSILLAIGGAVLLLLLYRALKR
jgi:uncharacterized membrane protein YeaQ/YmgE (transglycosylase-associated protein family)